MTEGPVDPAADWQGSHRPAGQIDDAAVVVAGSTVVDDRGRRRQHPHYRTRGTDTMAADVHADVHRRGTRHS